jgi:hypothetical protein
VGLPVLIEGVRMRGRLGAEVDHISKCGAAISPVPLEAAPAAKLRKQLFVSLIRGKKVRLNPSFAVWHFLFVHLSIHKESRERRTMTERKSAAAGGQLGDTTSAGLENGASDKRLVLLGLNALARAHQLDYFADGHRAASMVAAHLLCVENHLGQRARARIAELIDLNWASSELCKPFPDADPEPAQIDKINTALSEGAEVLREVGHNAIFAMLAIKGFRILPSAATPQRIDGVCALIRSIKPWRDVAPDPDVDPPPFADSAAAARFVLREVLAAVDRFVGFGQGFTGHMLTFGQALVEMAAMGDVESAENCRTAFRKYVTVMRREPMPNSKRHPVRKSADQSPTESTYWEKRGDYAVGIGHVFKYPYSYYNLQHHARDPALERAWAAKAYHLF